MAHKTLIGGTAYEISGGKTFLLGTVYSIDRGKTLIEGTEYEVGFGGAAMVEVSIKCEGVASGAKAKSAEVTITSEVPFAPFPSIPSYTVTTVTFNSGSGTPVLLIPAGAVIKCKIENGTYTGAGIFLNEIEQDGNSYTFTLTRNVSISLRSKVVVGNSCGIIKITET